jgi:hypothetical protein
MVEIADINTIGGKVVERIAPEDVQELLAAPWPAIVRERGYPWLRIEQDCTYKGVQVRCGAYGVLHKTVPANEPLLLFCVIEQLRENCVDTV